jgi:hypothetical protein
MIISQKLEKHLSPGLRTPNCRYHQPAQKMASAKMRTPFFVRDGNRRLPRIPLPSETHRTQ